MRGVLAAGPLVVGAYVVWACAVLSLVIGVILLARSRKSERRASLTSVALLTIGGLGVAAGLALFLAKPGAEARPESGPLPSQTLTPTLSPVPTAPDAPSAKAGGETPSANASPQSAESVEIGYEAIGSVEVGDPKSKIEDAFGKPSAVVETEFSDGKAATSYSYESGGRDFEVLVRDQKVFAYVIRSTGFATFSGVAVGDGLDKLQAAYPTKLAKKSETEYVLAGPRNSSVKFVIDEGKVVRIDGGRLG